MGLDVLKGILTDNKKAYKDVNIIGLLYQTGINIALGAGVIVFFCLMRPNNG
ncbi:hypothetical protein EV182_004120, partial [Spiromyces aspiralis]